MRAGRSVVTLRALPGHRLVGAVRSGTAVDPVMRPHAPKDATALGGALPVCRHVVASAQRGNHGHHARLLAASQVSASGALPRTVT